MYLIVTACCIVFCLGFTHVHSHNLPIDQEVTSKANPVREIRENFQNLFDSIANNDGKKREIYRGILKQEVTREQQTFDAMKEELRIAQKRNSYKKRTFSERSNDGENIAAKKREVHEKNPDTGQPTEPLYRRLYYCAFLIDEHLRLLEHLVLTVVKRKKDFRNYWKDEDPVIHERNLRAVEKIDDAVKERVRYFLNRSRGNIEMCFNVANFTDENSIQSSVRSVDAGATDLECVHQPSTQREYDWNVTDILRGTFSLMILNTPIVSPKFLTPFWKKANFRILIDGGANKLYDALFNESDKNCTPAALPHVLSGDFDSIREDVLDFFRKLNVRIIHTPDQGETDFFKALEVLSENTNDRDVVVHCDNIGRLDHTMQNLNTLFKCSSHETLSKYNIFLLNHKSLTWLLKPGSHVIHPPHYLWTEESHCGLIPVGQPCYNVTTRGLKYNLRNGETRFGKMVSTSNGYDMSSSKMEVRVSTDNNLIWTMSIDERILPMLT